MHFPLRSEKAERTGHGDQSFHVNGWCLCQAASCSPAGRQDREFLWIHITPDCWEVTTLPAPGKQLHWGIRVGDAGGHGLSDTSHYNCFSLDPKFP